MIMKEELGAVIQCQVQILPLLNIITLNIERINQMDNCKNGQVNTISKLQTNFKDWLLKLNRQDIVGLIFLKERMKKDDTIYVKISLAELTELKEIIYDE